MKKVIGLLALCSLSSLAFAQATSTEEAPNLLKLQPPEVKVAIQLPGMSHHFRKPRGTTRDYNETHSGIGLEWQYPRKNGEIIKYSAGVMRDSLATWGGYAAAVWQKELYASSSWQVDAGAGAFLFYRALEFNGPRRLVPAPLPVLSVQHTPTGLGLNVLVVPQIKFGKSEMPGVIFGQLTKSF